jgi:hypothetical protein
MGDEINLLAAVFAAILQALVYDPMGQFIDRQLA